MIALRHSAPPDSTARDDNKLSSRVDDLEAKGGKEETTEKEASEEEDENVGELDLTNEEDFKMVVIAKDGE